jgi:peptidoglycan/xylan/chitin deacetylase (PgdA/CDA1 family)
MREEIKAIGSDLLDRMGLVGLLRRATASRGGLVLALHRVLPIQERAECYDPHLVLSEPAFVSLLRLLQRDYNVVSLEDLLEDPRGSNGRPKVAITFDDGWEDNYRVAFPHFLAYQMPATVFTCTGLIGSWGVLPEERFARLWAECAKRGRLKELLGDLDHWGVGRKSSHLPGSRKHSSQALKRMPLTARLLLLDHFEQRYEVPPITTRRFMSWEDLRIMTNTGLIQIGSHTRRHASLPAETDRDIRREVEDSRNEIFMQTGQIPRTFAYPNGLYDARVADLVREAGYRAAVSTNFAVTTKKCNPLAIPRIAVDDTTVADASAQLSPARTSVYFVRCGLRPALSS